MKLSFLLFALLFLPFIVKGQVLISQYYEGASNNKWVELTNVGSATVDLTSPQLYLCLFSNTSADSPSGVTPTYAHTLTETISAGSSILFKHGSAVLPDYGTGTSSNACNFNGDDLVIISTTNDATAWENRIDVVGNGDSWGTDVSFYRNSTVVTTNTTFTTSEWTEASITTVNSATSGQTEYLGYHLFTSGGGSSIVEPSNHVTGFGATTGTITSTSIELNWTENDGTNVPDGYLIKASTNTIVAPANSVNPANDLDLTDSIGNVKVAHGTTSYIFSNCNSGTTYNFAIYPYAGSGENIVYKTSDAPTTTATTATSSSVTGLADLKITISEEDLQLTISGNELDGSLLTIYDITGKVCFTQKVNGNISTPTMSRSGIYLIYLHMPSGNAYTKRIIVSEE